MKKKRQQLYLLKALVTAKNWKQDCWDVSLCVNNPKSRANSSKQIGQSLQMQSDPHHLCLRYIFTDNASSRLLTFVFGENWLTKLRPTMETPATAHPSDTVTLRIQDGPQETPQDQQMIYFDKGRTTASRSREITYLCFSPNPLHVSQCYTLLPAHLRVCLGIQNQHSRPM